MPAAEPASAPLAAQDAPPQAVALAPADTTNGLLRWRDYLPSQLLDRVAVPRSAPDESMLEGMPFSGLPIRLRLFIDRAGTVVDAVVLQSSEDEAVLEAVRRMFLSTAFIAGRFEGQDVASIMDVELTAGEPR